jgi:hypothetical protein
MSIPLKERTKIDQLLARIVSGNFDANDVDGLLIKLRPYAGQRKVFREIADFVAHADARHKGVATDSMIAFSDRFRFFIQYNATGKVLDLAKPFPAYLFRLFLSQARQADKSRLKDDFRMSNQTLVSKIENNFQLDKATKTCSLRSGKHGKEFLGALDYVMGYLYSTPAFALSDFHSEFKEVLKEHKITFSDEELNRQLDRIGLCVFCLVSGAEIALPEGDPAKCRLGCEHHFRILHGERRLPLGGTTAEPNTFGSLTVLGEITFLAEDEKPKTILYPLITSDLNPLEHCDASLFVTDDSPNELGEYVVQVIDFADDMALTPEFKLVRADRVGALANPV